MASDSQYTPATLTALLKSLSLGSDDDNHEQILKHANNVLKKHKTNNSEAVRAKLVALIKLDRCQDALEFLKSHSDAEGIELEQAYCLYKVGRIEEAVRLAQKSIEGDKRKRGLKHVEAQSLYRLEKFQDTAEIYKDLQTKDVMVEAEEYDLRVNLGASETQLVFSGQEDLVPKTKVQREDLETFETAFNAACQAIARCEYAAGSILLKRARELCESMEGLSPEEIKEELVPVIAQEIFVSLKTGKTLHATELSQTSDLRNTSDIPVKVVATNNDVLTLASSNPHLALRLHETIPSIKTTVSSKPFSFQEKVITRNNATLAYQIGKANAARSISQEYLKKYPDDYSTSATVAAASIPDQSLDMKHKSTSKVMQNLLEKQPKDIGLAFTAIQAYITARNTVGAVQVAEKLAKGLEDDPNKRFSPAVVGVIAGLYNLQGKKSAAKEELDKATTYWNHQEHPNSAVLLASASSNLLSTNPQDQKNAASLFSSINAKTPSPLSNAGAIASDPARASEEQISELTPISKLLTNVNVDALISSGIASTTSIKLTTTAATTTTTRKRPADDTTTTSKAKPAKKKRKIRLPKGGVDPNKKPDPERWLPLRDRSSYKPKGKKDKKRMKDLTQGGVVASGAGEAESQMIGGNSVKKVPAGQNKKKKGKR